MNAHYRVARVYLRVSTSEQDLERQESVVSEARQAGYYIAGVYREHASGARADRPVLARLIEDLQSGDVVIAEKIDRISRLPLAEAERLVSSIRERGARLAVPGLVELSDVSESVEGVSRVVLDAVQDLILKISLQMARDEYETRRERQAQGIALAKARGAYTGRKRDHALWARIYKLRFTGHSIADTAELAGCSVATVKRVWSLRGSYFSAGSVPHERGDAKT